MDLTGRKIAITGASAGLGQALAICCARAGAELFLSARTQAKADATAMAVSTEVPGAVVYAFQADMSRPEEIRAYVQDVAGLTPHIDVLINNASHWLAGGFESAADEDMLQVIDSTLSGAMLVTRHCLPLLRASAAADIVFVNGTPGLHADRHPTAHIAFSAAKSGLAAFADRLRHQTRGSGMRVMSIFPPNFRSVSAQDAVAWAARKPVGATPGDYLSTRNVVDAIFFALSQDRICSIDDIVMSNNGPL